MNHITKHVYVMLPFALNRGFIYQVPDNLTKNIQIGDMVNVNFRGKKTFGVVWQEAKNKDVEKIKTTSLKTILNQKEKFPISFSLSQKHIKFLTWMAEYTLTEIGKILHLTIGCVDEHYIKWEKIEDKKVDKTRMSFIKSLSSNQKKAYQQFLCENINFFSTFQTFLLEGVTGSGKTQIYGSLVESCFYQNLHSQILILLPEIGLILPIMDIFYRYFGEENIAIWHSGISKNQKCSTWNMIVRGEKRIIIGARSALFLPLSHLKLIIVDEEHDQNFKQESQIIYNARDMAILKSKIEAIPIVLASATPSLETMFNVQHKRYKHIFLGTRYKNFPMPNIKLINMRYEKLAQNECISSVLISQIQKTIQKKEQSLLFVNRRGYSPIVLCQDCGYRLGCRNCSTWLIYHKEKNILMCHQCGYKISFPDSCPGCQTIKTTWYALGVGVEKLADEVQRKIPEAKICILSSDENQIESFIDKINKIKTGAYDIIVGTQIIAKGHTFKDLTLVGIIDADSCLLREDIRGSERCFQTIQQVAGRAGRVKEESNVWIQTFDPTHPLIQCIQEQNKEKFITYEMNARKNAYLPPFSQLVSLIISCKNTKLAFETCQKIIQSCPNFKNMDVLGPVEAPIFKIRGYSRFRFLIRIPKGEKIQNILYDWLRRKTNIPTSVKLIIDIDPYHFF